MFATKLSEKEKEKVITIFHRMRRQFNREVQKRSLNGNEIIALRSCLNELMDYQMVVVVSDFYNSESEPDG